MTANQLQLEIRNGNIPELEWLVPLINQGKCLVCTYSHFGMLDWLQIHFQGVQPEREIPLTIKGIFIQLVVN